MDAWFEYVLGVSEAIYSVKLHNYEDACASLLLTAAEVAASAVAARDDETNRKRRSGEGAHEYSGHDTIVAPATTWDAHPQSPALNSSAGTPLISVDDTVLNISTTSLTTTTSVLSDGAAASPGIRRMADACAGASATTALRESRLDCNGSFDQSKTETLPSSALYLPETPGDCSRRTFTLASGASVSPAEAFEALADAMQLQKPMRAATSRSEQIDDIQAEADFVFQELEDAFTLQSEDIAAAAASCTAAWVNTGVVPRSSPILPSSTDTRFQPSENEGEGGVAAASSNSLPALPTAFVTNGSERHLLYGELTSVGVRQLQAISIASSCVVRGGHKCSRSRDYGTSGARIPVHPSTKTACSCCSSSVPASSSMQLVSRSVSPPSSCTGDHSHGRRHTSRGAVVVAVDVGSGNGRLLFEWARLAAAACSGPHTSSETRHMHKGTTLVGTELAPATLDSRKVASGSTTATTAYAASKRCGNLLAAAYTPLGIEHPATVWCGWIGVGIELAPSRMRIARKALVPHYLNLKEASTAPLAGAGASAPFVHLDPCPPEPAVAADTFESCSLYASLQSGVATHTTAVRSVVGAPTSTDVSVAMTPGCPVPQPSARVLLYEGDALAPGVLSNATLCRFPNPDHHRDPMSLHESCTAHDHDSDVQGWGADNNRLPCAATWTVNLSAAAEAMSKADLLNRVSSDANARRGSRTPANRSLASTTKASSDSSACSLPVTQNYYPLCSVEGGPLLTGREDPHLVVFCCGLGFDEAQVRQLCQRLEDMLLRRSATAAETTLSSVGGTTTTHQQLSKDARGFPLLYSHYHHDRTPHSEAPELPVDCASPSRTSSERSKGEDMEALFGIQPPTATGADASIGIAMGIEADVASHRHWNSVTCVLLLRPMDVLLPTFPLFRYACRIYDTVSQPISAEDTGLLLSTGHRSDGSSVPFSVRSTPTSECRPESPVAGAIVDSDVWRTTLETTWMNAAPAWVVRFRF
ncbi:hypothetical protein, conserved [Leishmania tarentolae]|uniref:Uncharacterized protein n=1 Tax=Leishmania tarentolae TaxID=5689 RepID=A0A640KPU6_LEITA|nr:hypothetical protein, conserved [Leishmania tarentolae]